MQPWRARDTDRKELAIRRALRYKSPATRIDRARGRILFEPPLRTCRREHFDDQVRGIGLARCSDANRFSGKHRGSAMALRSPPSPRVSCCASALTLQVGESLPTYITFYPAVMVAALLARPWAWPRGDCVDGGGSGLLDCFSKGAVLSRAPCRNRRRGSFLDHGRVPDRADRTLPPGAGKDGGLRKGIGLAAKPGGATPSRRTAPPGPRGGKPGHLELQSADRRSVLG